MAIRSKATQESFKLILQVDDAIGEDVTDEIYTQYLESLDEALLELKGVPTRFVFKGQTDFGDAQKLKNAQMGIDADGKPVFNMGSMLDDIRTFLIDIENPPNIPEAEKYIFKKDGDGKAAKQLIAKLDADNLVVLLYGAKNAHLQPKKNQKKI
jgi:hypothetical protein